MGFNIMFFKVILKLAFHKVGSSQWWTDVYSIIYGVRTPKGSMESKWILQKKLQTLMQNSYPKGWAAKPKSTGVELSTVSLDSASCLCLCLELFIVVLNISWHVGRTEEVCSIKLRRKEEVTFSNQAFTYWIVAAVVKVITWGSPKRLIETFPLSLLNPPFERKGYETTCLESIWISFHPYILSCKL